MSETAALAVHARIERVSGQVVDRFCDIPTGNVCDAMGRTGALDHGIKPVGSKSRFAGAALTVDSAPNDNLAAWAALEHVRPGDVVVIATGDWTGGSTVGDVYIGMARNRGAVAVVTDGLVRDLAGIEAVGIPAFARGLSPNSPWKNGPGRIGSTLSIGGCTLAAGDLVVGDADGVVAVPRERAAAVAEQLAGVLEKERAMEQALRAGEGIPAWLPEALRSKGVVHLD